MQNDPKTPIWRSAQADKHLLHFTFASIHIVTANNIPNNISAHFATIENIEPLNWSSAHPTL